jgi:arylsulfatase A-like enzyme
MIIKGMTLGLIAGLIVTLFDSFYMLVPNVYVPISYPFLLFGFNVLFWIIVGSCLGLLMKIYARDKGDFGDKENFYWVLFFLLPFTLMYGLLGRIVIPLFTPTLMPLSPIYDYHLSFVWAALIIFFLIIFRKRVVSTKSFAISFVPEIVAVVMIFNFCSNIARIESISWLTGRIGRLFFHSSEMTLKDYIINLNWYLIPPYVIGVVLILVCCLVICFKIKALNKRQNVLLVILFFVVSISLGVFYKISYNRYVNEHYSSSILNYPNVPKKTPYVILIVLDTVRADRLSIYGGQTLTKSLEEIALQSVVYENCVAPSPWTTPSHASLFTGLYPTEHGSINSIRSNVTSDNLIPTVLDGKFLTLAELFAENDYRTAAVVSNYGALSKAFGIDQGFQLYDAIKNIGDIFRFYPFRPLVHLFCHLTNVYPKFINPRRTADDITKETVRALKHLLPSAFFLFINYTDAHAPYRPPRPFDGYFLETKWPQMYKLKQYFLHVVGKAGDKEWNTYQLSQYDGEISFLDYQLGKLFRRLKALNIYDSSLIVITSDHGELFGEHGFRSHDTPMYEGVLKVPLIIKFPYSQKTGREKKMIGLTDLYHTILSFCELMPPDETTGENAGSSRIPVVAEFNNYSLGKHRVLYDEQYKYMEYEQKRGPELYNLQKDPLEQVNLSENLPATTKGMNQQLNEWIREHKPKADADEGTEVISREVEEGLKALGYIK